MKSKNYILSWCYMCKKDGETVHHFIFHSPVSYGLCLFHSLECIRLCSDQFLTSWGCSIKSYCIIPYLVYLVAGKKYEGFWRENSLEVIKFNFLKVLFSWVLVHSLTSFFGFLLTLTLGTEIFFPIYICCEWSHLHTTRILVYPPTLLGDKIPCIVWRNCSIVRNWTG